MRIPHIIDTNAIVEYEPSPETLNLVGEKERQLLPENFRWDDGHCVSLADWCVARIGAIFPNHPLLRELPCHDRNYLLEILDTNLDLSLAIPLIDAEIYWKRRYHDNYGSIVDSPLSWKVLYIEKYIQHLIEEAQPQYNDEDNFSEITTLCSPYIKKLMITQLQAWKPPLTWEKEDIPEFYPIDHINIEPILAKLCNIEELGIIYGVNEVSEDFHQNMFKLTLLDCERLGKAINNHLKSLKILRIRRSQLLGDHCRALTHCLVSNETIEELDLSHCQIGDVGALCIAKVLCVHPTLRHLNLCNNNIGVLGAEGIGFALLMPNCGLITLDLRLNRLNHDGAMGIMRALVRSDKLEELSMAGCLFDDDETPVRVGQMLQLNSSLRKLDISNNWLDDDGGDALVEAMLVNRTLQSLDVRNTDISSEQNATINKYLVRNRGGPEPVIEDESPPPEEEESAPEAAAARTSQIHGSAALLVEKPKEVQEEKS